MISIVDSGSSYSDLGQGTIATAYVDRKIYQRLQRVVYSPLGSEQEDSIPPISVYIAESEKFYTIPATNTAVATQIDTFIGSLGKTQYYPHPDNTFKDSLIGG